ncbi:MAG: (Fe-S)-binding protein, partial [Nitrospinota bacterium]|nr:(Fe-S)-binding protein [Nitrospinota bacterium]
LAVAHHEACHLVHGQKVRKPPMEILRALPGVEMRELAESDWCCGSAGVYNLTQPEMAGRLLKRKVGHILDTGASVVAAANPGCIIQIESGLKGKGMRVLHPVELLAEAYQAEAGGPESRAGGRG